MPYGSDLIYLFWRPTLLRVFIWIFNIPSGSLPSTNTMGTSLAIGKIVIALRKIDHNNIYPGREYYIYHYFRFYFMVVQSIKNIRNLCPV